MTYAFLRQLSSEESLLSQRASILGFAEESDLAIDSEYIEFESTNKTLNERDSFQEFLHDLKSGDALIIDRIEVLGREMEEVIVVINCILSRDLTLYIASNSLKVDCEVGLAKILPLIVQMKSSSQESENISKVGRPRGRLSTSKFDIYLSDIISGLKAQKSVSAIARELGISRSSLKDYIESRNLRKILDEAWLERAKKRYRQEVVSEPVMACTLKSKKLN